MTSPENQQCASCVGALSFPIPIRRRWRDWWRHRWRHRYDVRVDVYVQARWASECSWMTTRCPVTRHDRHRWTSAPFHTCSVTWSGVTWSGHVLTCDWPRRLSTPVSRQRLAVSWRIHSGFLVQADQRQRTGIGLIHRTCSCCSRVVSVLDSGAEGPQFKSQPRPCRITVLGKLFTPIVLCSPSSKIGSSPLKSCGGYCRPGGK